MYLLIPTISYQPFETWVLYVHKLVPDVLFSLFFCAINIAISRYFDF